MNKYGYTVITNKSNKPLFVVEFKHQMLASFSVFATSRQANNYIKKELESLKKYAPIIYDINFKFAPELVKAYKEADYNRFFENIETGSLYIDYEAEALKPGTLTNLYSSETGEALYYIGPDPEFKDCITLATDPKNPNTRHRWTKRAMTEAGYILS